MQVLVKSESEASRRVGCALWRVWLVAQVRGRYFAVSEVWVDGLHLTSSSPVRLDLQ